MDDAAARLRVAIVVDHLGRRPASGIATYTRGLLQGLREMGPGAPAVALVSSRPVPGFDPPACDPEWLLRSSRLPGPVLTRLWDRGMGGGMVGRADVVHATSLAAPPAGRVAVVVTVHDMAWREVPEAFPLRGRRWHEAAFGRALRRAAVLVTPSERTAALVREAVEALGATGRARAGGRGGAGHRKPTGAGGGIGARDGGWDGAGLRGRDGAGPAVVVIPEGCDHLPSPDAAGAIRLLGALGVTTPYLLSVSTLEPRKNLVRLAAAYARARPRLPEPWPLVVVGPPGWGAEFAPVPGVKLAGVVSDAVLAGLYARARCLAYVPLVEGWGLPPVEAMAACLPVVASPMPSTGGAALEVDPFDADAITEGLVCAASDDARRTELVTAGLLRAAELTWRVTARRHVEVWEGLARR